MNSRTSPVIVGSSAAFDLLQASTCLQQYVRLIHRAAATDAPVLVVGESGTGKELVARSIHDKSLRAANPFVCLNLGAVPLELAETVLFGHEKGAFTGAIHSSPGYCRQADTGTLFLDEIGEADLMLQVKLLRFLQNREIQPVGSASTMKIDVRIVAATNLDLERAVHEKRFREDLFYRLNVIRISIPPLRERSEDFESLIDLFLNEFNGKYKRHCQMTESLRVRFQNAHWPGNIRQLRSLVECLVLLADGDVIALHDLSNETLAQIGTKNLPAAESEIQDARPEMERMTHLLVESVLNQTKWNVPETSRRLGISRATLYRWIKKYQLPRS